MDRPSNPLERHAESLRDGPASLVAGLVVPLHTAHNAFADRPVHEIARGLGDQSAALDLWGEPDAELANSGPGVEPGEERAADEPAVHPDAVDVARIGRVAVGE